MTVQMWYLIIGLSALLLGWGIGFLDSNRKSTKKIRAAELHAQIQAEEARQAAEAASLKAAEAARAEAGNNLLRLWSDLAGQVHLEVDGAPIDTPAAVLPDQRRRLIALLNQMRPWLEASPAAPAPRPAPQAPVQTPAAAAVPPPLPAAPVEPVKVALGQSGTVKTPEPPAPKSIVQQIDEVLQKRLAGTAMGTRNIHLAESVTGGVEVWVGLDRYKGIDEVPDPEVVAAIRAAISEWETRVK